MNETTTTPAIAAGLEELRRLTAYRLAGEADCSCPDSPTSAGAAMLESVRDVLVEAIEYNPELADPDADRSDLAHEIADGAPDVYTHTRWQEFVDLGAYNGDPSELGGDGSDMTQYAAVCLYIIAERLVGALFGLFDNEVSDYEELNPEDPVAAIMSELGCSEVAAIAELARRREVDDDA